MFLGPKFGIDGIREYTKVFDKPLLGSIIKPKTGISPQVLLEMVKELVDFYEGLGKDAPNATPEEIMKSIKDFLNCIKKE